MMRPSSATADIRHLRRHDGHELNIRLERQAGHIEDPARNVILIEKFFAKIKQFRAIATRYGKTARNFLAVVQLVASIVWLN